MHCVFYMLPIFFLCLLPFQIVFQTRLPSSSTSSLTWFHQLEWIWQENNNVSLFFGRYHNLAFVSDFPPPQLMYYEILNETHGVILSQVKGRHVYTFWVDKYGLSIQPITSHHVYRLIPHQAYQYAYWYMSTTGDRVVLAWRPTEVIMFDISIRRASIVFTGRPIPVHPTADFDMFHTRFVRRIDSNTTEEFEKI